MALRLPASKVSKLLTSTPSAYSFSYPSHILTIVNHVSKLSQKSIISSQRNFSSSPRIRSSLPQSPSPSSTPKPTESSKNKGQENPGFESESLSDMFKNASKTTRVVLIVGFVLVSTAESVTWGVWAWNKWKVWRGGEEQGG